MFALYWTKLRNYVIWIIGITILCGLTIKDFLPLCYEYTHNNVATQIRIIGDNETAKIPQVTLCVPWSSAMRNKFVYHLTKLGMNQTFKCYECDLLTQRGWDVWSEIDLENLTATNGNIMESLTDALLHKLFADDGADFETLDIKNLKWNQVLIESVWQFFACMLQLDVELGPSDQNSIWSWCFQYHDADLLLSDKAKIDKLYDRILIILCEYIHFDSNPLDCFAILKSVPKLIFSDKFCFSLPLPVNNTRHQVFITSYSSHGVNAAIDDMSESFHLISDLDLITWRNGDALNSYAIHVSKGISTQVEIQYQIQLTMVDQKSTCYRESTPAVCEGDCLMNKVIVECQCVPFSFCNHLAISELPYCNSSLYMQCQFNKESEVEKCKSKCENRCEYVNYRWHVSRQTRNKIWREFDATISGIFTEYIEFSITKKNTWEQFLTQIGAAFNFYLGFSGVSLIVAIIYLCDCFKKWRLSKIEKIKRQERQTETMGLEKQLRVLQSISKNDLKMQQNFQLAINQVRVEQNLRADQLKAELKSDLEEIKKMLQGRRF